MKFNKQFPNDEPFYSRFTMEKLLENIQEPCLDKQKVRETIEKGIETSKFFYTKSAKSRDSIAQATHRGAIYAFESLKKELNL